MIDKSGKTAKLSGTLEIDIATGKIVDVGLIMRYDADGTPRCGTMSATQYFGPIKRVYPIGYPPSFEEIQAMKNTPVRIEQRPLASDVTDD